MISKLQQYCILRLMRPSVHSPHTIDTYHNIIDIDKSRNIDIYY